MCKSLQACDARALQAFSESTVSACVQALTCSSVAGLGELPFLAEGDFADAGSPYGDDTCARPLLLSGSTWPFARLPWRSYKPPEDAAAVGEACVSGELRCQTGTYCRVQSPLRQSGSRFCGVCEAYRELEEACDAQDVCAVGRCIAGACQETLAEGEHCDIDERCRSGQCVDGVCKSAWPSMARIDGSALGETCEEGAGATCFGDITLACVHGRCVPRPAQGDACDDDRDCRVLARCRQGRCAGEECVPEVPLCPRCAGGEFCDVLTGTCQPVPQAGQSCSWACAAGLFCDVRRKVCLPMRTNGEPCSDGFQCHSGVCLRDLLPYCNVESCAIPPCDDCGLCGEEPGVSVCQ